MRDVAVIGGGIVGLATAAAILERHPRGRVVVLEKESAWAVHQSGRNSGVIHSGIYYRPGSLRARLAAAGSRSMVEFCRRHDLPHAVCGKLILAAEERELPRLRDLERRGIQNGLEPRWLGPGEVVRHEPRARAAAGIFVPTTGIADFRIVADTLARLTAERGGDLRTGFRVERVDMRAGEVAIHSRSATVHARLLISCAGLHSDRIARAAGARPSVRIVPFRGEYWTLVPPKQDAVRGLIYPVPDPSLPFLGVHLTRTVHGQVHAGPNAVLALCREGYLRRDFLLADALETFCWAGFWRLVRAHGSTGVREALRSLSRRQFARSVARLVPEIGPGDLVPDGSGVRAQALRSDGRLADDFLIERQERAIHVLNAPSPAATASLEIGRLLAEMAHGFGVLP